MFLGMPQKKLLKSGRIKHLILTFYFKRARTLYELVTMLYLVSVWLTNMFCRPSTRAGQGRGPERGRGRELSTRIFFNTQSHARDKFSESRESDLHCAERKWQGGLFLIYLYFFLCETKICWVTKITIGPHYSIYR